MRILSPKMRIGQARGVWTGGGGPDRHTRPFPGNALSAINPGMADTVTPEIRSRMMAAVRSKDTGPEMAVRRGLHALGFRYSLHARRLPGRPDLVLPKYKAAIFVEGCFWHGHQGCRLCRVPSTRTEYWTAKIARNRERDARNRQALDEAGWRHLTIWECALRGTGSLGAQEAVRIAAEWLRGGFPSTEIRARPGQDPKDGRE